MEKQRLPCRAHGRGFTLVEMTITICILVAVAALTMPRWARSLQRYNIDSAAKRIVADLGRARRLGFTTSATQTVNFNVSANQYTIPGLSDPNNPTAIYTVTLSSAPYNSTLISTNLGGQPVTYNGYGVPVGLPAGGGKIVIAAGQLQHTITIDPTDGTATIQ